MAFTFAIRGLAQFRARIRSALVRLEPAQARNTRLAGEVVIGEAKKQFKGSRTRARYEIKKGRRVARKPPRPVTSPRSKLGVWRGTYRQSITQDVTRVRFRRTYRTEIGPVGIRYARVHEFGLRGMPKRPVLNPAVKASQEQVFRLIGRTLRVI